jgi:hypothetical protein
VFTSFFANVKKIPAGLEPVSIARGSPRFWKGRVELDLAPTRAMLKMTKVDYDAGFNAILEKLDPQEIYDRLGDNAVLLCWEKPNERCHRRRVAEWLEAKLGIVVPELGLDRASCLPYDGMVSTLKAEKGKKPDELLLF